MSRTSMSPRATVRRRSREAPLPRWKAPGRSRCLSRSVKHKLWPRKHSQIHCSARAAFIRAISVRPQVESVEHHGLHTRRSTRPRKSTANPTRTRRFKRHAPPSRRSPRRRDGRGRLLRPHDMDDRECIVLYWGPVVRVLVPVRPDHRLSRPRRHALQPVRRGDQAVLRGGVLRQEVRVAARRPRRRLRIAASKNRRTPSTPRRARRTNLYYRAPTPSHPPPRERWQRAH